MVSVPTRLSLAMIVAATGSALGAMQRSICWFTGVRTCHPAIYERWSKTRMANVVRDPKSIPTPSFPTCPNPTRW